MGGTAHLAVSVYKLVLFVKQLQDTQLFGEQFVTATEIQSLPAWRYLILQTAEGALSQLRDLKLFRTEQ